jgi:hypothetical protein
MKLRSEDQFVILGQVSHTNFVILSSIDLGSRINVGRVTRERSAPGRSCDMMWERTVRCCQHWGRRFVVSRIS